MRVRLARGGAWPLMMAWALIGCVAELSHDELAGGVELTEGYAQLGGLSVLTTRNPSGSAETAAPVPIDQSTNNPFFHDFGTNRRTCGTCHVPRLGWTITPEFARSRRANDPLFVFDGSDCLPPGVPNPAPAENSTQMLEFANVRIDLPIPANADYTLVGYTDPLNCPTPPSAANLRMYRRPLPSANTAFLATVMWDGRETTHESVFEDLAHQANGATIGHAQATSPLSDADRISIVEFETGTVFAQRTTRGIDLSALNGRGGAQHLYNDVLPTFFIGINDPFLPGFTNFVFDIYREWEPDRIAGNLGAAEQRARRDPRAAIGRGEVVFNTKPITIANVPGLNGPHDASQAPIAGFCGTCHDTPNVGNHSVSLAIDIGVASPTPLGGLNVVNLPTYTFQRNETGETITVTDGGRGLITGRFADLGKTKGPILRGLAARAPYFHNGSARDLATVVEFYDQRFAIGMTAQEKSDLVAFLTAL